MHEPLRILTVCTANVCRSPVAEHLLARHLSEAGWRADVRSAGTHGGLNDVHPYTASAATASSIDLAGHVSRFLDRQVIATEGADLVLTMTRDHLRQVVALHPSAWPRTFTLKELARRAADVPPDVADFASWRGAVGEGRRAADLLGADPADDISDPFGGPAASHVAMVAEIDEVCARIARLMPRAR